MSLDLFELLKSYCRLDARDSAVLRDLLPRARLAFPRIVDEFYLQILDHEGTRRVLQGPAQLERLKVSLFRWLEEVFLGPYDAAYYEKRRLIGIAHVRVGLSQAYVFGAMSHIRRHLETAILSEMDIPLDTRRAGCAALAKVLDIDLALIAGSYHEEEKYRDLVEHAPDMIHEVDREGRILSVNVTGESRLGYSRDQLLSMNVEDLVIEEDRPVLREHLRGVFTSGQGRCEFCVITSGGARMEAEAIATAVRNPITGEVVATRAYWRDITQRKEAQDALRRERDTIERYLDIAAAILCVIGADGRFLLMNRKGCEVLGLPEEDVVGREAALFVPERLRDRFRSSLNRIIEHGIEGNERLESPLVTRAGDERTIEWHNAVLTDATGKATAILSSGMDITERLQMEATLVEQASLARVGEMAAIVAHEVKNPLAGIGGALQVIVEQLPRGSSSREMVEEILERLDALNDTVNDLLLFARPRLPRKEAVPILSLIEDTIVLMRPDPAYKGVSFHVSGQEVLVQGEAELLKPALMNVLINAAQAVGSGGQVLVEIAASNGSCSILVQDNGPGIPPELREKVFEPFFSTKHRGTGLGLPITKRIIQVHGGEITVSCPASGGTAVSIRLPTSPAAS